MAAHNSLCLNVQGIWDAWLVLGWSSMVSNKRSNIGYGTGVSYIN